MKAQNTRDFQFDKGKKENERRATRASGARADSASAKQSAMNSRMSTPMRAPANGGAGSRYKPSINGEDRAKIAAAAVAANMTDQLLSKQYENGRMSKTRLPLKGSKK